MAISITASGSVVASDIHNLVITRDGGGNLSATVTFMVVTASGLQEPRTAEWTLSAAEKAAVATSLLPGAIAAVEDTVGL